MSGRRGARQARWARQASAARSGAVGVRGRCGRLWPDLASGNLWLEGWLEVAPGVVGEWLCFAPSPATCGGCSGGVRDGWWLSLLQARPRPAPGAVAPFSLSCASEGSGRPDLAWIVLFLRAAVRAAQFGQDPAKSCARWCGSATFGSPSTFPVRCGAEDRPVLRAEVEDG